MKLKELLLTGDINTLKERGPITIVAFGDSVTHGALNGEINYETAYWNRLKQKLNSVRDYMPVNVINAGIGGITAAASLERMQRQVLDHHPDLIIVCFGLNDVNRPLDTYLDSLREIFTRGLASGSEVIFMTPNMLNTYVAEGTPVRYLEYAEKTARMQNDGTMDHYMECAIALAKEVGVTVCDCYGQWKELSKTENTTMMLINRINHPTAEMHELFAEALFRTVMGEEYASADSDSTMYGEEK